MVERRREHEQRRGRKHANIGMAESEARSAFGGRGRDVADPGRGWEDEVGGSEERRRREEEERRYSIFSEFRRDFILGTFSDDLVFWKVSALGHDHGGRDASSSGLHDRA